MSSVKLLRDSEWIQRIASLCNTSNVDLLQEETFNYIISSKSGDFLYKLSNYQLILIDLLGARISPILENEVIIKAFEFSPKLPPGIKLVKAILEERFRLYIALLTDQGVYVIEIPVIKANQNNIQDSNKAIVRKLDISKSIISDISWDINSDTGSLLFILCKDSSLM